MVGVEVRKMNEHAARLMTITDAAKALAISKGQIYRLIAVGAIRAVKVGPQATRVPVEDVERLAQGGIPRTAMQLLRRRGGDGRGR
jgi:excisionase family DNA binding protein